jgi:hypothetical protein
MLKQYKWILSYGTLYQSYLYMLVRASVTVSLDFQVKTLELHFYVGTSISKLHNCL